MNLDKDDCGTPAGEIQLMLPVSTPATRQMQSKYASPIFVNSGFKGGYSPVPPTFHMSSSDPM
jgi:hypothetical protein